MKLGHFAKCGLCGLLTLAAGAAWGVSPGTETELSADDVIQKAVARAQQAATRSGPTAYTYTKLTVTEELDASGNVKQRKERVYRVYFQRGSTWLRLVSVNGHPPDSGELKLQAQKDGDGRQLVGGSKSGKGDYRENFLTPELVARYDFTLLNQESVNGRQAYQIAFQPRSPVQKEHGPADRFLNRISGVLWVDIEEFEIARADIRLGSHVEFLGGMVGSLKKLAFTVTRTRVADGLWLNTSSSGDFEGRKLLDPMRIKTKSQATDFRQVRVAS